MVYVRINVVNQLLWTIIYCIISQNIGVLKKMDYIKLVVTDVKLSSAEVWYFGFRYEEKDMMYFLEAIICYLYNQSDANMWSLPGLIYH